MMRQYATGKYITKELTITYIILPCHEDHHPTSSNASCLALPGYSSQEPTTDTWSPMPVQAQTWMQYAAGP